MRACARQWVDCGRLVDRKDRQSNKFGHPCFKCFWLVTCLCPYLIQSFPNIFWSHPTFWVGDFWGPWTYQVYINKTENVDVMLMLMCNYMATDSSLTFVHPLRSSWHHPDSCPLEPLWCPPSPEMFAYRLFVCWERIKGSTRSYVNTLRMYTFIFIHNNKYCTTEYKKVGHIFRAMRPLFKRQIQMTS